jgi:tetratricopeptide (TPR) repeat protein
MFDSFIRKQKSEDDLVNSLVEIAAFGAGEESAHEKSNMDIVLAMVESNVTESSSSMLLYWLGIAWRNYTAWHIRGDDRKPYLERATNYFRQALEKSKHEWPMRQPLNKRHDGAYLDQITIAGELGSMLVEEKIIRNLDEGEKILRFVADNTNEYEPCLCAYAELFYKREEYEKAAIIALDANNRALHSAEWKDGVPPAPIGIAGMSYRALGRASKKAGDLAGAKKWFGELIKLGVATENDKKIYSKL